jgi:hypothetical protein
MLKIDIKWLVPAVLLSSDRLLDNTLDSGLISGNISDITATKLNALKSLNDYQSYLSAPLRREDAEFALRNWLTSNEEINISSVLKKINKYFLEWKGDRFEVKSERLEEWLSLIAMVDPAWVIGYGYVDLLQHNVLGFEQVMDVASKQCPSGLPKRFDGRAIADNHIHLTGHGHNSLSLLDFSLYLTKKPNLPESNWPYRPEYSSFNSGKLDVTQLPLMVNQLFSSITNEIWNQDKCHSIPTWKQIDLCDLNSDILSLFETQEAKSLGQRLLASSHLHQSTDTSRWLFIAMGLIFEYEKNTSKTLNRKIMAFVQSSHILRNYMIVSGVGLSNFTDFFGFRFRKPSSNKNISGLNYKSHSLENDFSLPTYREFRVAPNVVVKEKENRSKTVKRFLLKPKDLTSFANELVANKLDSRSHFVIHFNRGFSRYAPKGDNYQYTYRNHLLAQVRKLQEFFSSIEHSDLDLSLDNQDSTVTNEGSVDLRALVRGFDVAGNENELPIALFAPTLRVLRSGKHEYQSRFEKRLRQPFLTIHSGEDYGHLLSGLRAIDEAVVFCDFKPGDRLGHALALGVDVSLWAKRQQRIYLTASEHLDNLVWCYFQGLELIQELPEFHSALCVIENKIQRWSSYVYGDNFSSSELHMAWQLRRNCPLMQHLPSQAVGTEWQMWVPDMLYLEKNKGSVPVKLWQRYLNNTLENTSSIKGRANDIVSIDCRNVTSFSDDDDELNDTLSNTELRLIHAIQDLLVERYSKRQIVLEACPTSNIFIGRFKHYAEHPIYRWNPPSSELLLSGGKFNIFGIRKGPISVCVNTDDAGLMPTTIENEHRILKETAIKELSVSSFNADSWIDHIRQTGVDIFKSNHIDWTS